MLPLDNRIAARLSARTIQDSRACHFYDPQKLAGKAIAEGLGGKGHVAWDIYLFYNTGSEWGTNPPAPVYWVHQLQGSNWADEAHYHSGDHLIEQLHRIMQDLTNTPP